MRFPHNPVESSSYPRAVYGAFHVQFVALNGVKARAVCGASLYRFLYATGSRLRFCGKRTVFTHTLCRRDGSS